MAVTMVRNNQAGPTTFTDDSTGQKPVVWQGAGDPRGQDVRAVPKEFMESVNFLDALEVGIFSIVQDEREAQRAQQAHRDQFRRAQEAQQNVSERLLDQLPNNDLVLKECIGPKGKTGQMCGEAVTVKAIDLHRTPPLCAKHKQLSTQFIPVETDRIVSGKPEVTWSRPRLGQSITDGQSIPE